MPERSDLLLMAISSIPMTENRLEKSIFLLTKLVPDQSYDDWEPASLGPYSKNVLSDIAHLIDQNLASITDDKYRITEQGKKRLDLTDERYQRMKSILDFYSVRDEIDLDTDSCILAPEFTKRFTIMRKIYDRLSEREPYKIPFTNTTPDAQAFRDSVFKIDMRYRLYAELGRELPKADDAAFAKLSGILENLIDGEDLDSAELVRAAR